MLFVNKSPCELKTFKADSQRIAGADTEGDGGWLVTPSRERKKYILQRISHLRLHCLPMRGFDHRLTLATNHLYIFTKQNSHNYFNEIFIMK